MSHSISVQSLSKKRGRIQALHDVSLHFGAGLIHGLIGPEGAGKTTLMRTMAGLLSPDSGRAEILDENNEKLSLELIREKIAYMPQMPALYPDLSVGEHIEFFSELYELDQETHKTLSERLLHITRLSEFTDRPASQLSGGMYKKLGLICALLRSPEILLLDEPTNGVDPISRREFWELLYGLRCQDILIIVTTAYMDEAERCNRTHLIQNGRVLASGAPADLMSLNGATSMAELFIKKTVVYDG